MGRWSSELCWRPWRQTAEIEIDSTLPIRLFFSIPVSVVVRPPPRTESRDSIKTLTDWRFDLPVTMATAAPSRVHFLFNFCNPTTILSCIFSVLECPRRFCVSAFTSKGWDDWHARTQKQRGGEKRANLCLSPAARLHWYPTNSGGACTDPWQRSGGQESLIRCENCPAPLSLRMRYVLYKTQLFTDHKTK